MPTSTRYELNNATIEFYNGHALKINVPIVNGCCLMLTKNVFETFPRMTDAELRDSKEQYAVDSKLYSHSLLFGKFVIVEDLSVYHIDNTYGQRRQDMQYFVDRNRWPVIDKNESWFIQVSKDIYPRQLQRHILETLRRSSAENNYNAFLTACKNALASGIDERLYSWDATKKPSVIRQQIIPSVSVFKITAPDNFVDSKNLKRGTILYSLELPDWARTDNGVVIEKVRMSVEDARKVLTPDKFTQ
jgi:hypothetical protein